MRLRQAYLVEQVLDLRAAAIAEWLSHDESWWAGFISHAEHSSDQLLVVAEMDDVVVGMARVAIDSDNHELSHFGMLYVEAPARGQGLGRELLAAREAWAREHGALAGEAWITVGQTVSEELHRSAGWLESSELRPASARSSEQIWRIEW
jgi:GNAT superfamily N-acetyltransferase